MINDDGIEVRITASTEQLRKEIWWSRAEAAERERLRIQRAWRLMVRRLIGLVAGCLLALAVVAGVLWFGGVW